MENSTKVSNVTNNTSPSSNNNTLLVIQLICYIAVIVVGTFGNILIFLSLVCKKKRKISDYFIVNLTITDLFCCIISIPFDIMELVVGYWPLGIVMCKIVYPLQTVLTAVSVVTLLFMALERYRAIIHPLKPKIRGKYVLLTINLLWITTIALVTPYMLILELKGTQCVERWPGDSHVKAFTVCVFVLLYVAPLSIILAAYVRVAARLHDGNHRIANAFGGSLIGRKMYAERTKRTMRVLKIFVSAVIAFAVCLLPYNIMWLWYDFGDAKSFKHYYDLLTFSNMLVYSNSAINPFIFGALSKKFRNCFCRGFQRNQSTIVSLRCSNGCEKSSLLRNSFRFKPKNPQRQEMNSVESGHLRRQRAEKIRLKENDLGELADTSVNRAIVMVTAL